MNALKTSPNSSLLAAMYLCRKRGYNAYVECGGCGAKYYDVRLIGLKEVCQGVAKACDSCAIEPPLLRTCVLVQLTAPAVNPVEPTEPMVVNPVKSIEPI